MSDAHTIQRFTPFTAANWESLKAQVKSKAGIDITSDAGQAEAKGVTVRWAYDASKQLVEVQLMDRKWFDPSETTIDQTIHDIAESIMMGN